MYRVNGKTYRALRSCDATGYHYVTEGDEITEITVSDSSENAKKRIDEYAVKNDTQVLYYSYNGHFYKYRCPTIYHTCPPHISSVSIL